MAMENTGPCGDFGMIMADLESENPIANVAAMNRASALIAKGKILEPQFLCRLIFGLASNMEKHDHDFDVKRKVYLTLGAIREAMISSHMNMDSSTHNNKVLHAIRCCSMDRGLCCLQEHASMVRMWTVQGQLAAAKMICAVFRLSPTNINNTRCVTTFASLMLPPYTTVVCACEDALLSLPPVPGFAFEIARAYCHILLAMPPQSSPQISSVVVMLSRLNQISTTMVEVDHPRFDDLAMDILEDALANCNLVLRKKALNLVAGLLTPRNVLDVLRLLNSEMEDEYILPTKNYGVTAQGAQGERQQPWLMEMEELLFVRIGLIRQADGSYEIASSSKNSASSVDGYPHKASLELTDNLAFLVHSGDALLADFVENMLSELVVKAKSCN